MNLGWSPTRGNKCSSVQALSFLQLYSCYTRGKPSFKMCLFVVLLGWLDVTSILSFLVSQGDPHTLAYIQPHVAFFQQSSFFLCLGAMGSYISIYNNTKDTYLVKVGPDEAAMRIAGIVTAVLGALATIIATAGAAAPVTSAMVASGVVSVFGVSTNVLAAVTGLAASISMAATVGVTVTSWATSAALFISEQIMTDGFVEIPPGQKHTFGKYSLSLWRQGTCRRVRVNPNNAEEVETDVLYMRPIFSGATAESVLEHNIQFWIDKWGHESREVVTLHKENFSASSQNIRFEDGKLSARCRDSNGQWHDASLDINHYYTNVDGIVQAAVEKPGNFMSTCSDLELQGSVLRGMAETRDKRKVKFELDLDIDIANKEGKLVPLTS